jgi:hypothetical protein
MNKNALLIGLMVIGILVFSGGTAAIVHHNDVVNNSHSMMMAEQTNREMLKKAVDDAVMKQADADKMAQHDAMMKADSTTNGTGTKQ